MADSNALVFDHLGLFKRMNARATTQDYRNKELIFVQGDKADAIYYVQHGNVKLTVASASGKKAVVGFLQHGDFFGEGCLDKQAMRICTATAIEPSTIARVKRSALVRIVREDGEVSKLLISYLLFRIARVQQEFVDQIFSSSEKRLARILLMMAGLGMGTEPEPVLLKVSQQTLAEMVGTTRSRVSHFMNRFREMGLINYNGTLQVHASLRTFLLQK
jgi:CRP-like cAMP-binding protein